MTRIDRRPIVATLAALALLPMARALAGDPRPAEAEAALLRLVPKGAGLTVSLVDLRGHAREILDSKIAAAFWALPAVKDWRASDAGRRFAQARGHIERALGCPMATIRDDLLGDAVVLSLHLAPGAPPDSARGLLLARVRDKALMPRLIDLANRARGVEVSEAGAEGRRYSVRAFPHGAKDTEYYRLFDDGTFAWSNSEPLLRGVVDRHSGSRDALPALGDDPVFRTTRAGLPSRSLVAAYLDPKFAARVIEASPKAGDPGDRRAAEWVVRALGAARGIGLAIEWRDGPRLHAHETLDPARLDPRFAGWARSSASPDALARRVPESAVAAAATTLDFARVVDALLTLVPESDRPRTDLLLEALRGVLLGRDLRAEILPRLGPSAVVYVEGPSAGRGPGWPPVVLAVEMASDPSGRAAAQAIENALRTLLCLYALDPKHGASGLKIESREAGPLRVTTLGGAGVPFAFGVGPDCLVVGTSSEAVARFGTGPADARLARLEAAHFPGARAYAAADVARLARSARARREGLARRIAASRGVGPEAAARDLDRALGLLELFDAAYVALSVDPAGASAHQALGLIGR